MEYASILLIPLAHELGHWLAAREVVMKEVIL